LVLMAQSERMDAPPVSVATISDEDDGAVKLQWGEGVNAMVCAPASSFGALRDAACGADAELTLTGSAIRRTWR